MKSDRSQETPEQRQYRWRLQHGDGDQRRRKQVFWRIQQAQTAAEHVGSHVSAYPCRWHDDYERGETAPEHFHVGKDVAGGRHSGHRRYAIPLRHTLADHFPTHLLPGGETSGA